ncbi:MAG: IMPACT family protein [Bacilli bacterium]
MKRIKETYVSTIEIKKSKFICLFIPLQDDKLVNGSLSEVKKEYPKATHYCYAYRINKKEKSNDDGEPSGTAGRPILEFLIKNELEDILCVVIRYFGGIKLGASGLIRAYIDSCQETYSLCKLYEIVNYEKYGLIIEYKFYDSLMNYLKYCDQQILDSSFEEKISITLLFNNIDYDALANLTNGSILIESLGKEEVYKEIK